MLTYSFHFLQFNNLSFLFSRKNPSLAQFIPGIYNKIIIKIVGYFWGVTIRIFQNSKINSLFSINRESRRPVDRVGSINTNFTFLILQNYNKTSMV